MFSHVSRVAATGAKFRYFACRSRRYAIRRATWNKRFNSLRREERYKLRPTIAPNEAKRGRKQQSGGLPCVGRD